MRHRTAALTSPRRSGRLDGYAQQSTKQDGHAQYRRSRPPRSNMIGLQYRRCPPDPRVGQGDCSPEEITQYEEEHAGEEGMLEQAANDNGNITKAKIAKRMKEIKNDKSEKEAYSLMQAIEKLFEKQANFRQTVEGKTG